MPQNTRTSPQLFSPSAEKELITRAQAGDAEAFSALYRAHAQTIYRYLLVRVNEPAQAEDLTAEVFLRVVDSLPNYVERGAPFGAWLFRIARGKLIDHYRRSARRPMAHLTDTLPADDPEPGVSAETNESWRELQAALAKLTDEQRDVIQFRFMEDWSLEDTARVMNKSVNAVKALQHRALNALNRHMTQHDQI